MFKQIIIEGHKNKRFMDAFNQGRYIEKVKTCNIEGIHIYSRLKSEIQNLISLEANIATLHIFKHEIKCLTQPYTMYKNTDIIEAILNTLYDELELENVGYTVTLDKYANNYIVSFKLTYEGLSRRNKYELHN